MPDSIKKLKIKRRLCCSLDRLTFKILELSESIIEGVFKFLALNDIIFSGDRFLKYELTRNKEDILNRFFRFNAYNAPIDINNILLLLDFDHLEKLRSNKYPIQYLIFYSLPEFYYSKIKFKLTIIFKSLYSLIWPKNKLIKKHISKDCSYDFVDTIRDVNFAVIVEFHKELEISGDHIDWARSPELTKFKQWLDSAVQYITVDRKKYEERQEVYAQLKKYPPFWGINLVKINNNIETDMENRDNEILKEFISYRSFFWT